MNCKQADEVNCKFGRGAGFDILTLRFGGDGAPIWGRPARSTSKIDKTPDKVPDRASNIETNWNCLHRNNNGFKNKWSKTQSQS